MSGANPVVCHDGPYAPPVLLCPAWGQLPEPDAETFNLPLRATMRIQQIAVDRVLRQRRGSKGHRRASFILAIQLVRELASYAYISMAHLEWGPEEWNQYRRGLNFDLGGRPLDFTINPHSIPAQLEPKTDGENPAEHERLGLAWSYAFFGGRVEMVCYGTRPKSGL